MPVSKQRDSRARAGGPAMLGVDVPDDIITLAVDEKYFPLGQGFVQLDEDA